MQVEWLSVERRREQVQQLGEPAAFGGGERPDEALLVGQVPLDEAVDQLAPALGLGLGVVRQSRMYAAIDNAVTLPAFTRADGAAFVRLGRVVRAQVNVENLFDTRYFANAHSNNNIMPGAPRTVRLGLTTDF